MPQITIPKDSPQRFWHIISVDELYRTYCGNPQWKSLSVNEEAYRILRFGFTFCPDCITALRERNEK